MATLTNVMSTFTIKKSMLFLHAAEPGDCPVTDNIIIAEIVGACAAGPATNRHIDDEGFMFYTNNSD